MWKPLLAVAVVTGLAFATPTHAKLIDITVTVQNLAATNSVSSAPLRFGFDKVSFDAFDIGNVATAPIISIAEGGNGADWLPAFAAADPTAVTKLFQSFDRLVFPSTANVQQGEK